MASRSQMRLAQLTGSLQAPGSIGSAHALNAYSADDLEGVLDAMGQAIARIHGEKDFTNRVQGEFKPSKFDVDTAGNIDLDGAALNIGTATGGALPVNFDATSYDLDASAAIEMNAGAASHLKTSGGAITFDASSSILFIF
ncbi:MAG: hypothetical protein ACXADH_15025 [Candidatus Kariarchaeaceae archaeon]|jgi:hypothetical protein